jgi:hypothetical protein
MTTKSVLSLGAGLCLCFGLSGCQFFKSSPSQPEVTTIPEKPAVPVASKPENLVPVQPPIERPYMSPPLILGYQESDPILPTPDAPTPTEPDKEQSLAPVNPTPLPPVPNPGVLPILEQKPGGTDPLTLPNSVTENANDGLYYKAGEPRPYTGSAVSTYANGQREFEGFFKNGRRDGLCLGWYENGRKQYEGIFRNGKLHTGYEYWYYANSLALKLRGVYEKGHMVRGQHWNRQGGIFR